MKHSLKAITALLLILCMAVIPVLASCTGGEPKETTSQTDETGTSGETEAPADTTPETEAPLVIPPTPNKEVILNIGDQTGHPENSAETVDVDALLKYDSNYNALSDYKVFYKSSGKRVKDAEAPVGLIKTQYPTSTNIVATENVRKYGAMGNGTTDDTAAFKSAINAVNTRGGGVVFVPAGYYCLNGSIQLPKNVGLVGELVPGTAEGTVLCIYGGKGKTDVINSALKMDMHSAVRNVAFWYPEQTIVNGKAIPFPPTILQTGSEGVTIENVTFVNSYFAIDFAHGWENNSLQYTRDVYGTPLQTGYENDKSYDIGKVENLNFSADYWLNSGLPGTPNEQLLRAYLLKNAVGMIIERIDWTYFADVTIDGYRIGVLARNASQGASNGSMYNFKLLNCKTCLGAESMNFMLITDSVFTAVGNDGLAMKLSNGVTGNITMNACVLKSEGDYAVSIKSGSIVTFTDCTLESKGKEVISSSPKNVSLLNCTVSGTTKKSLTDDTVPKLVRADYGKTVVCKPKSDAFIDLSKAPYSARPNKDVTKVLQSAIDSLKETGGTVYLPAGSYPVNGHIDVWAGIEIRGAQYWPQNGNAVTNFNTAFGEKNPNGESLFTLYDGAGMVGIGVYYPNLDKAKPSYSYTIRGNGKNIYLIDITLPTTWNGVDFETYRCDNHYVEYIHAAVMNNGIKVGGGSQNGIIRDCHFTPNTFLLRSLGSWWSDVYTILMRQGKPYVIGDSQNEIVYHNFTYGAYEGLTISKGAKDVYVLCHGVDAGNMSVRLTGNSTATLVNTQLVNLNGSTNTLVDAASNFTGSATFFNYAGWGTPNVGFSLAGEGTINVVGGVTDAKCGPFFALKEGNAGIYSTVYLTVNPPIVVGMNAKSLRYSGNVFGMSSIRNNSKTCEVSGAEVKS